LGIFPAIFHKIRVKGGAKGKRDKACFYFGEGKHYLFRLLLLGGVAHFAKNNEDGPIKWLLLGKKNLKIVGALPH
jgi:hypothetical protein